MSTSDTPATAQKVDPITYAVVRHGFLAAAYDMFSVFKRTTMLPLLYEFNDFGMNVYDDRLNMIADAPGLPVSSARSTSASSTRSRRLAGGSSSSPATSCSTTTRI